jgi:hypothetical protein
MAMGSGNCTERLFLSFCTCMLLATLNLGKMTSGNNAPRTLEVLVNCCININKTIICKDQERHLFIFLNSIDGTSYADFTFHL